MKQSDKYLLTVAIAFAGGVAAGMLLAPDSVPETRRTMIRKARIRTQRLLVQLQQIERQAIVLEQQLQEAGGQFSARVQQAGARMVNNIVPGVPQGEVNWEMDQDELERDLRRMPHE